MLSPDTTHNNRNDSLEALLAAHADALSSQDKPKFDADLDRFGAEDRALFAFAERLNEMLTPVAPSGEFLRRLKQELLSEPLLVPAPASAKPESPLIQRWRNLPAGYRLIASLGGLTLTAGLTLLAASRVRGAFHRRQSALNPVTVNP